MQLLPATTRFPSICFFPIFASCVSHQTFTSCFFAYFPVPRRQVLYSVPWRACLRAIGKPLYALPSQRRRGNEFSSRISLSPSRYHGLCEKNVKGHARQRRVRGKNSCGRINGCRERRWRFCCHRNVQERPEDRNSALHGAAWHGARDNHRQDEREEKGERVGQPLTSDSWQKPGPSAAPHALCLSARGCTTFSRIRSLENLPPSIFALAIPLLSLNATRAEFRLHFSASHAGGSAAS